MKQLFPLTFAVLLFGCQQPAPSANTPTKADSTVITADQENENDGIIRPDQAIPAGFLTDSVQYFDDTLNFQVTKIYAYPAEVAHAAYKQQVQQMIDTAFRNFENKVKQYVKEDSGPDTRSPYDSPYMFDATPINYYQDDHVVSIRYVVSTMTAGAVHAISGLVSVNYDKTTKKRITADNYFSLKTSTDSNLIVSVLDESFGELRTQMQGQDSPWVFYGISHLDFNIRKDSVCFNFPDYMLGQGPSMIDHKVHKSKLSSMINPDYR